jgi:hypothetical protein
VTKHIFLPHPPAQYLAQLPQASPPRHMRQRHVATQTQPLHGHWLQVDNPSGTHFRRLSADGDDSAFVRLRGRENRAVEVRSCAAKSRAVSNRNCVGVIRGGEQRNENDQSVTQTSRVGSHCELDSVGVTGRACYTPALKERDIVLSKLLGSAATSKCKRKAQHLANWRRFASRVVNWPKESRRP